jgi:hypothetical protein
MGLKIISQSGHMAGAADPPGFSFACPVPLNTSNARNLVIYETHLVNRRG